MAVVASPFKLAAHFSTQLIRCEQETFGVALSVTATDGSLLAHGERTVVAASVARADFAIDLVTCLDEDPRKRDAAALQATGAITTLRIDTRGPFLWEFRWRYDFKWWWLEAQETEWLDAVLSPARASDQWAVAIEPHDISRIRR